MQPGAGSESINRPWVGQAAAILQETALKHCLSCGEMIEGGNQRQYVRARREVYARLYVDLGWSLTRIGLLFGKHHTTVLHALKAAE